MAISQTLEVAQAMIDAGVALVNGGSLRIYSGTAPTNASTALSGNTLLAELTLNATAFAASTDANPGAIATANSITGDSSADATGTATFFRLLTSGNAARFQGSVTATSGGGDLELSSTSITALQAVNVTSLTLTQPES